jgi:hypothetical protein
LKSIRLFALLCVPGIATQGAGQELRAFVQSPPPQATPADASPPRTTTVQASPPQGNPVGASGAASTPVASLVDVRRIYVAPLTGGRGKDVARFDYRQRKRVARIRAD